jgi:uncharacterized integral membrane protein
MKKLLYAVIFLVIFVLGLTFAVRNPDTVHINYYFGIDVELPLTILLLCSLGVGVLIGYLTALTGGARRWRRPRQDKQVAPSSTPGSMIVARRT